MRFLAGYKTGGFRTSFTPRVAAGTPQKNFPNRE